MADADQYEVPVMLAGVDVEDVVSDHPTTDASAAAPIPADSTYEQTDDGSRAPPVPPGTSHTLSHPPCPTPPPRPRKPRSMISQPSQPTSNSPVGTSSQPIANDTAVEAAAAAPGAGNGGGDGYAVARRVPSHMATEGDAHGHEYMAPVDADADIAVLSSDKRSTMPRLSSFYGALNGADAFDDDAALLMGDDINDDEMVAAGGVPTDEDYVAPRNCRDATDRAPVYARPISLIDEVDPNGPRVIKNTTVNTNSALKAVCVNDPTTSRRHRSGTPTHTTATTPSSSGAGGGGMPSSGSSAVSGASASAATEDRPSGRRWTFLKRQKPEQPTKLMVPTSARDDPWSTPLKVAGALSVPYSKLHTWKKRWCVLSDTDFLIFKDEASEAASDIPLVRIEINSFLEVVRTPGSTDTKLREFILRTGDASHMFQAYSADAKEAWISAIDAKVSAAAVGKTQCAVISGWLVKSRHGHTKRRWCSLLGRTLYFSKSRLSPPSGTLKVYHTRIESDIVDSDEDDAGADDTSSRPPQHCFCITSARGKHYFLSNDEYEYRKWIFFLQLAAGNLDDGMCTDTERILKNLSMKKYDDLTDPIFQDPILVFDKKSLESPTLLTTLPSKSVEDKALAITKSIHLYTSVVMDRSAMSYHVRLAQEILTMTANEPGLHNEIYCQLIRLTHKHPYSNSATFMQCWHLLVLMIPICLPTSFFLRYLGLHLLRNIESTLPCANIAEYGKRCLQRTLRKGLRKKAASVTEILSVVDQASTSPMPQPMSITIRLPTGSEFLCGFDPQSAAADVSDFISSRLTMRSPVESSFGLFVNDPSEEEMWHAVRGDTKICDLLASWEVAYREASVGKVKYHAMPQIMFQRRLYFRAKQCSDEVESILLAYQVSKDISAGKFKLADEHIPHMTALLAQMEWGNCTEDFRLKDKLSDVAALLPPKFRDTLTSHADHQQNGKDGKEGSSQQAKALDQFETEFVKEWKGLHGTETRSLGRTFVAIAKSWRFYGASLFEASETASGYHGWLAVHEDGITILSYDTFDELDEINFSDVTRFGLSAGQVKLEKRTVNGSFFLTFDIAGERAASDCVYTMTCYVNDILRREGVTSLYARIKRDDHATAMDGKGNRRFMKSLRTSATPSLSSTRSAAPPPPPPRPTPSRP